MSCPKVIDKIEDIPNYYNHPLLNKNLIKWRKYQVDIANKSIQQNTLVVLPTALGKTIIALISIVKILERAPNSKILVLAPTRPLIIQHFNSFQQFLHKKVKCCLFSSNLSPINRAFSLNNYNIFFSTPQIIQNDLKAKLYTLDGFGQIIFDETHKARKKYAYTYVAKSYLEQCNHPLILGLTASPGKDVLKINELCETLKLEQIMSRNSNSSDVKDYIYPTNTFIHKISLPDEIMKCKLILDTAIRKILDFFKNLNIFPNRKFSSKFQYIQLIQDLKSIELINDPYYSTSQKDLLIAEENNLNFPYLLEIFESINENELSKIKSTIFNKAINAIYFEHLKEILTTQDIRMYKNYINKLYQRGLNGNLRINYFLNSKYITGIDRILQNINKNPKIEELKKILADEFSQNPNIKIIIFTQYREMGQYLSDEINNFNIKELSQYHDSIEKYHKLIAKRFVGQSSRENDKGLNQKSQTELIRDFTNSIFNVLVATSVAEEGLDIPSVNAVIFYDSVPSEIRLIQRRGRTGRHEIGKCYFLVAKDTLDEIYYNVSQKREEIMNNLLQTPGAIELATPIHRSQDLPVYKEKSIEEIKKIRKYKKQFDYLNSLEEIEEILLIIKKKKKETSDKREQKRSNVVKENYPKGNDFEMVTNYTSYLTNISKNRLKLKLISEKELIFKPKIKKIFNWIIHNMKTLGKCINSSIYCDINKIYTTSKEEEINFVKIQNEIHHGLNEGIFKKKKDFLVLNSDLI